MSRSNFARAPEALPLGRDGTGRSLPWLFGLLAYAVALAAVGLLIVNASLRGADDALATRLTLQIPADASPARLRVALAVLHQTPGVASARLLEPAETARLLTPWLGSSVAPDQLPVPRLIDLRADPRRNIDFAALHRELASVVPGARLEDHRPLLQGMRTAALRIDGVLAAVITAALALIAVAAAFSARLRLAADRSTIELLHLLGAADRAIAWKIAQRALRLGALGGAIGGAAALATLFALRNAGALVQLPSAPLAAWPADWRPWVIAAGVVPAAGLIAMASARLAVLRRLARLP